MSKAIFWFRRDLRLDDNSGLFHALTSGKDIVPVFIFDKEILDKQEDKDDARVTFIHEVVSEMNCPCVHSHAVDKIWRYFK